MSTKCYPLVGGRVMRVTRLDSCGRPQYGDTSQIVSEGFISIGATANIDDGEEISVTNANGKKCVNQPACPSLTNISLEITFCDVDPELYAMLTGNEVVYDYNGDAVGFRVSTAVSPCDVGFGLEVWSNVPGVACSDDPNAEGTFGYLLYPFVQGGILGDYTIENAAISFVITGAQTKDGTPWGVGPYDVVFGGTSIPAPLLTPLGSKDHFHVQLTEVAPPTAACGSIPLDDPSGSPASEAVAGVPGTWGPSPAIRPWNFAALVAAQPPVVANPVTPWTEGQYVVLGDGTDASWDGTAWVEGEAPAAGADPTPPLSDVTAGAPGTFDPPDASIPADLSTLAADSVVGDAAWAAALEPAWTTPGDFVSLGDGSSAHWNGANWTAGTVV